MFTDRKAAGFHLARRLAHCPNIMQVKRDNLLVVSIPRGGVVIGNIGARMLGCPHDILIVKKIGFPDYGEFAIGAVAEDGTVLLNHELIAQCELAPEQVNAAIAIARDKVEDYVRIFRHGDLPYVTGKTVILVDDGIATGETLKVAICWLREMNHRAEKVIVAVPVCSPRVITELAELADEVVCLCVPQDFIAVGQYYSDFSQVSEMEVLDILYGHEV